MRLLWQGADTERLGEKARREQKRTAFRNAACGEKRGGFFVLAAFCFAVFLASAAVPFFIPAFFGFAWNGYYTVLADGKADIREISRALAARGFTGFLSAANSSVEFSDFDTMEELPVCALPARLLPEDPRMDDFLRGVGSLFRSASGSRHILYFPAEENPLSLAWKLKGILDGYDWSLVEWRQSGRIILVLLFCAAAFLYAYGNPSLRFAAIAFALPWLNFLVHGAPGVFAAGVLVYFALMSLAGDFFPRFDHALYSGEGFRARGLRPRVFAAAFVVCGALMLAVFSGGGLASLVPLFCGLAGSFAIAAFLVYSRRRARTNREHRLFVPLAILPERLKPRSGRKAGIAALALLVCLCAVPLVFRFSAGFSEAIPRPRPVAGIDGFSRENLRRLWAQQREGLPDFSDYLCHRAFQTGFLYGYSLEFPLPGSRVSLPRYREENGIVSRTEETILSFDDAWYESELQKAEESGVGKLLARQGAAGIFFEPASQIFIDKPWVLRYALLAAASLLPYMLIFGARFFRPRRAGKFLPAGIKNDKRKIAG